MQHDIVVDDVEKWNAARVAISQKGRVPLVYNSLEHELTEITVRYENMTLSLSRDRQDLCALVRSALKYLSPDAEGCCCSDRHDPVKTNEMLTAFALARN